MVRVKICGLTNKESAWAAVEAGADAIGFVFAEGRRRITPVLAREIIRSLPPYITTTGVFVNEELNQVNQIADFCRLDLLQLHGDETPEYCNRAVRPVVKTIHMGAGVPDDEYIQNRYGERVRAFLLDTFVAGATGGTGQTFPWSSVQKMRIRTPIILAGGLHPVNVAEAIRLTQPFSVDVSSGVETNGQKDPAKMREFVHAVRSCSPVFFGDPH
ncbi:phosphoribosylanthranilate isomerase [Paenibacillus zeisoli]|uniref:N-(5'-phosphoribosyl)anthranilate isomerase n=1 Tax=Paenibacillus zeisoli TaxID=2496267 RepID=A0A3S1BAI2_9BACL|nr:phosphoribosylanthranilate isomerase [Paenibacillus zeisoli]RUT35700.1 phosphoribosylanthranilate isomerase [Paenibacillus zeisoli]